MESWKEELYSTSYGNDLAHYGIEGMKWGVRRYQNEDGTLTEEGKARYGGGTDREINSKEDLKALRKDIRTARGDLYQRQNAARSLVGSMIFSAGLDAVSLAIAGPMGALPIVAFNAAIDAGSWIGRQILRKTAFKGMTVDDINKGSAKVVNEINDMEVKYTDEKRRLKKQKTTTED